MWGTGRPSPLDRVADQTPGGFGIHPVTDLHPLARLQVLVVLEEVLDLVENDLGHVREVVDVVEPLGQMPGRDGDDLLVLAGVVLHRERPDGPDVDHAAGHELTGVAHHHVDRVAVLAQGMGHEAVVPGVGHGGVEEAVDDQHARVLVQLVLDGLASYGHLDDDIHVVRRALADGDGFDPQSQSPRVRGGLRRPLGQRAKFSNPSEATPMDFPIRAVKDSSLIAAVPAPSGTFASGWSAYSMGSSVKLPRPIPIDVGGSDTQECPAGVLYRAVKGRTPPIGRSSSTAGRVNALTWPPGRRKSAGNDLGSGCARIPLPWRRRVGTTRSRIVRTPTDPHGYLRDNAIRRASWP